MLDSLNAWFFWEIPSYYTLPIIFIIISVVVWLIAPNIFSSSKNSALAVSFLYILTRGYTILGSNLNGYIGLFITSVVFIFFVGINGNYKKDFIIFFTNAFSILIGISLIGWIIYILGVNLPNFSYISNIKIKLSETLYIYKNFYVFVLNTSIPTDTILPRFSSIFLEPGYFSLVLVILLYINNFNLTNKTNLILFVALFFTFSLAGWLLGMFTYIMYTLKNSKKRTTNFILISSIMLIFYYFFSYYNEGNNVVNEYILTRLKYDDSNGTILGYNRTGEEFDNWFSQYFLKSKNILFGTDISTIFKGQGNVGWKVYLANYGLFGLSLYLLFLFYIFYKNKNYKTFILFVLYVMIFVRGHHVIYYSAFPILYICGCSILRK